MKILQINKYLFPKGGSETYMFGLGTKLSSYGYDVEYWGMQDDKNIVEDKYDSFIGNIAFDSVPLGKKITSLFSTIYSRESIKKIQKILDRFSPDIVHIHNFNYQITPSILPEIKKRNIKIVYTAHDSQLVCPYHRLYNFQVDKICEKCVDGDFFNSVRTKCFNGSLFKSFLGFCESRIYHSLDFYNKHFDLIICPSQFLADLLKKQYRKPIATVHNFVDMMPSNNKEKEDYILYYGRISAEKGISDIVPLFDNSKIKLKIVGSGPDMDKIRPTEFVEILGPKYNEDLFDLVRRAKFTIVPSKWYENCPMTIIESFACGTPVIGAKHSGIAELIENGRSGYLLDFGRFDLEQQLMNVYQRDTQEMNNYCLEKYSNEFHPDIHVPKVVNLYERVLNEGL